MPYSSDFHLISSHIIYIVFCDIWNDAKWASYLSHISNLKTCLMWSLKVFIIFWFLLKDFFLFFIFISLYLLLMKIYCDVLIWNKRENSKNSICIVFHSCDKCEWHHKKQIKKSYIIHILTLSFNTEFTLSESLKSQQKMTKKYEKSVICTWEKENENFEWFRQQKTRTFFTILICYFVYIRERAMAFQINKKHTLSTESFQRKKRWLNNKKNAQWFIRSGFLWSLRVEWLNVEANVDILFEGFFSTFTSLEYLNDE